MSFVYAINSVDFSIMSDTKINLNESLKNLWNTEAERRLIKQVGLIKSVIVSPNIVVCYAGNNIDKAAELLREIKTIGNNLNRIVETAFKIHNTAQKDDIEFIIDKEIVKEYSSVGEQKNSVIAFKLAEIKNIESKLNKKPILILDDLFSELDYEKIENILNLMDEDIQTFITTTEIDKVDQKLIAKAKIFKCIDGKIKEE